MAPGGDAVVQIGERFGVIQRRDPGHQPRQQVQRPVGAPDEACTPCR